VEAITAHDGPALLSHESLGGSRKGAVARAVESFPDHDIRVVVTCRDLGRQLPAVWQEKVKNGDTVRYESFLDEAFERWNGKLTSVGIWRSQNIGSVCRRWAKAVGAGNVCLVTVPPPGAEHSVLWDRFREAAGLPDTEYRPLPDVRNPSLGAMETELLRRLTEQLPEDLPWPVHSRNVKRRFAEKQLTAHRSAGPLIVPLDRRPAVDEVSATMVETVQDAGYAVIGDLVEITPHYRDDGRSPDSIPEGELLERALQLMVPMVLREDEADAPQQS
jgi:hypothetical protein